MLKSTQCSWPLSHLLSSLPPPPPGHTHLMTTSLFHYRFRLAYLSVVTWMFCSELSNEQLLVLSTLATTCLCTSLADYMRMLLRLYKYKYIHGSVITCPFRKILEVITLSLKVHKLVTSQIIGLYQIYSKRFIFFLWNFFQIHSAGTSQATIIPADTSTLQVLDCKMHAGYTAG